MGIRLDLVISFIIVGILTIVIIGLNSTMLKNSVDSIVYNNVQTFADVSTDILQEEIKMASVVLQPSNPDYPDSILRFITTVGDTLKVEQEGRNLHIIRQNVAADTIKYDLSLSAIQFDLQPDTIAVPYYLYVHIRTESRPGQHVSSGNEVETAQAFSEMRYYLRNVHLKNN